MRHDDLLLVAIQDEGPRTANGNPPPIYAPQHVNHTDNTRFSRDNLPKNPLEDDSPWYLDKPDKGYVNLCDAGTRVTFTKFETMLFVLIAYRGDLKTLLDAFKRGTPTDITDKFMKTPLMVGKLSELCPSFFFDIKTSFSFFKHVLTVI
jgi:hypothetical protein